MSDSNKMNTRSEFMLITIFLFLNVNLPLLRRLIWLAQPNQLLQKKKKKAPLVCRWSNYSNGSDLLELLENVT